MVPPPVRPRLRESFPSYPEGESGQGYSLSFRRASAARQGRTSCSSPDAAGKGRLQAVPLMPEKTLRYRA